MHTSRFVLATAAGLLMSATPSSAREPAATANRPASVPRWGAAQTQLFDSQWRFARFGLQADGTSMKEPEGLEKIAVNDVSWRKLDLPHDWAIEGPFRIELNGETGKLPYQGIGWYRKHFTISVADKGKRVFLDVDGAMAYARIWLNGSFVGTWPYGYSSFRMDLTPFLNFGGENVLAVRLDTERWESRWYSGGGIYRHVWMVKTDPVHVAHWGTFITMPRITDGSATVTINVDVENQGERATKATVRTEIRELDEANRAGVRAASFPPVTVAIDAGGKAHLTAETTITNPKRWDLASPRRYLARTTVAVGGRVVDTYLTPFGIRMLEFTARQGFLLNGRRVQVQGTCNHHDHGALGAAINTSALRRQLTMLKEMGCNALRTSHNPPAPELLELADQMGFLVWDEAFDCWKTGKREWDYSKLYDEWHQKDLQAMVRRDRNHPSVFIWSIGNEVPDQRDVAMTKHLANIVRAEDPTRPVSNGYNDPDGAREAGSPVALEIMGVNYFFSRQAEWDTDPRYANKPTIGSETSSCVSTRGEYFFGRDTSGWQISSYDLVHPDWGCTPDDQFRTNARFPHLMGEFVWTGVDYLGEPTPFNSNQVNLSPLRDDPARSEELASKLQELRATVPPSRSSYFGIIDLCGFPKDRFYLYQSLWRPDLPMAHILPHWNWPERVGQLTPVHVYTSGNEAELFVNGKSMGRRAKQPGQDFRLAWDSVRYEPGVVTVVAYKNGAAWASDEVRTTGKPARVSLSADRRSLIADGADLVFVTARVQDETGLTVPRSRPLIRFVVEGPGEIMATDNGDPTSFVPFRDRGREAFNGVALAIVKARRDAHGKLRVTATSGGLAAGHGEIIVH